MQVTGSVTFLEWHTSVESNHIKPQDPRLKKALPSHIDSGIRRLVLSYGIDQGVAWQPRSFVTVQRSNGQKEVFLAVVGGEVGSW